MTDDVNALMRTITDVKNTCDIFTMNRALPAAAAAVRVNQI